MVLRPLIICGPSGVGKGTIIEQFMTQHKGANYFGFTVSHTTRSPRPGEVHGTHYFFTDKTSMQADIDAGKFLEHALVHGNLYGTSLDALYHVQNAQHKFCLLDIDVQGVQSVKRAQQTLGTNEIQATFVFIAPPSLECLRQRLEGRGTETPESIEKRSKNAIYEMEYGNTPGNFDYTIINDTVENAVSQLKDIVRKVYNIMHDD
jgi:guanylate kinase